ncbi:MAG TPA: heme-binding beta-barrel domain-containing protein [Myxococcales bacterium]|nr:heme-binding beta-barrel domain-containing protein [Myxococcales bacterium]
MDAYPKDIYSEPEDVDPDTLSNLGPLRALAGVFEGQPGQDEHPSADGSERDAYVERAELHPTDPQLNGPQLLYGLRYRLHIVKPGEKETFHDQVGYFLWEPKTKTVMQTLAIPRGLVSLAIGFAEPSAREFELLAGERAIVSAPFLDYAFRTVEFRIRIATDDEGWSYEEDTVLQVRGRAELFHHTDRNRLVRVGPPIPNPLMRP